MQDSGDRAYDSIHGVHNMMPGPHPHVSSNEPLSRRRPLLSGGQAAWMRLLTGLIAVACCGCSLRPTGETDPFIGANPYAHGIVPPEDHPPHQWTKFVRVRGQPEPVPAEWVSTPEGMYAHNIVLPNPVPKDSGYRRSMSAKDYFLHLCEKEAGEFVYRKVEDVAGFLFSRPPQIPDDRTVADRYRMEAPMFEAQYQNLGDTPDVRGIKFVDPPWRNYKYYEEPLKNSIEVAFVVASEFQSRPPRLMSVAVDRERRSEFAVTWRGLRRPYDREHGIAGSELIVVNARTGQVYAFLREYGLTGTQGESNWMNAARCPSLARLSPRPEIQQTYRFLSTVLQPQTMPDKGERPNDRN